MQKRNITIDIFKGIAIMLIVLGHLDTTKLLHDFIFMFHVPAFFFVAGMTFNSMLVLGLHIPLRNVFRLVLSRMGISSQQSSLPIFITIMVVSIPLLIMAVNKYTPFLVGMRKQKNTPE